MKRSARIVLTAAVAALGAAAVAPEADASYRVRGTMGGFDDATTPTSLWDWLLQAFSGGTSDSGVRMDPNG